jgi:hypothetical protein
MVPAGGDKQMFDFIFIYETDNNDDDGSRTIRAASMDEARAIFKAAIISEGQNVKVHAIKGTKA